MRSHDIVCHNFTNATLIARFSRSKLCDSESKYDLNNINDKNSLSYWFKITKQLKLVKNLDFVKL